MPVCSWESNPIKREILPRFLARRNDILFGADADRHDGVPSLTHDQHCNIVATAAEIPVKRPSNDCGMPA